MAGSHGGARTGAGRKPRRIKHAAKCNRLDKKLADHIEQAAQNLIKLADGGYERVTQTMKPAGLVQIVRTEETTDARGNPKVLRLLEPAFPDLPPEQLVCVERRVEIGEPDRAANEYIIDRIAGRPVPLEEPEDARPSGAKVTEEAHKMGMEKMKLWREQSAQQLDSIRNPLTGEGMDENESTSEATMPHDSSMTDEF